MKQIMLVLIFLAALLAACGPAPTPAPTEDVNATIMAMAGTIAAETLTAQPTATLLPTETVTATPPPPTDTTTPTPTIMPTPTGTMTPQVFIGCFAPAGVGNTPVGTFRMENNTQETLRVNLNGTSLNGDRTVNCSYIVTTSFNVEIIFGNYNYIVQIGQKRSITGKFDILSSDKTTMRIYDKKVVVVGP